MLLLVGRGVVQQLFENGFSSIISLLGEISEALRASPDATQLRNGITSSVQSSFCSGPDSTKVVLSDSGKYLTPFPGTSEYALFRHARRPNFASPFGINNRDVAWSWAVMQIKTNVGDEQLRISSLVLPP